MQGKKLPKHSGAVRLLIDTSTYRHCACVKRHLDVFDPDQSGRPGPVEDATFRGPCDRDPSGYLLRENPWLQLQGGGASYNTTSRTAAKTGPS